MDYAFLDPWHAFLPQEPGHVLGLVGDGDLAALGAAIAGFYGDCEREVALCTGPTAGPWPEFDTVSWSGGDSLPSGPRLQVLGPVGRDAGWVDELRERHPQKVVICLPGELAGHDGAGDVPWPRTTSLAVILMAGQSVGLPAEEVLPADGRRPGELYEWTHLEERLLGAGGILERIPPDIPVVAAVSGLEEVADSIGLFALADRLMQHPRLPLVAFVRRTDEGTVVRAAYREGNGESP